MGRHRESRTGIAVLAFIVASAAAQFNSPADVRGDCADKSDGIYPTGHCSTYFIECSGGRTTKQNCSSGLWFNPQSSQCDYREKIDACQDPFSCIVRDDGVYGEGCSAMFWFCTGGQLQHTTCPPGTFFNVDTQTCDYRGNIRACGGVSKASTAPLTRSNRLTTVAATSTSSPTTSPTTEKRRERLDGVRDSTEVPYGQTYPTYPPRQRISGTVSKTPLAESSAGTACAGKDDGSHEKEECSTQYVLCWAGTGEVMNCPKGLMFNKMSGQCDYPLNVVSCTGSPSISRDSVYGSGSPLVSAVPSTASLPIPRQPVDFDCSTLSDGEYGSSCTPHYLQCVAGVSYPRRCTEGLVYNPLNNQCDHKDNCGDVPSTDVSSKASTTVVPVTDTVEISIGLDCSSLSDGLYSRGCVAEFSQCASGVFYLRKCPEGLVFDDVTKACDYPEICSAPLTSSAQDNLSTGYSPSSPSLSTVTSTIPAIVAFDCSSRVDGLYSDGCVSSFFECSSGKASSFSCPSGLLFDGVAQRCDYADKCGQPRPMENDSSDYQHSQSLPSFDSTHVDRPQPVPVAFECSSRVDGVYGEGCSPVFYQCVSGLSISQKCPDGLFFDQKKGACEYTCHGHEEAVAADETTTSPVNPTLAHPDIDCYNRPNGMYSSGCSRSFVQCANGMAFDQLCPEGLVFLQEFGRCDYPSSCDASSSMTASSASSVPSSSFSAPYQPSIVNEETTTTTILPPKRDRPSGVLIDCTILPDGQYTSGCTHAFVQCVAGTAYPLECQAGLVFDQTVLKCVWPGECSSEGGIGKDTTPSLPMVSLPSRPSDAPSTVYDMKEEKEEMVTDAPLPVVSNDGTVCTGTGRRSMGKCSSGFVQCIGGKLIARRCPGQSLFDEKIGLCVYDLDECEMDVDVVDVTDQETTVSATAIPAQDAFTGYSSQPVQSAPSYTEETTQQSVYSQYSQSTQQNVYQNGYQSQDQTSQYQSPSQDGQYQRGEYQSVPQNGPVYSSFGDSSLPLSLSTPECDIGSFRRVSACSSSFDLCSPTARQWIRKVCGKSHRFDSSTNRCRPIFEIRECDEPMSSYVPPPVQSDTPAAYPDSATSFQYGVPLSGREYQEKHVVDPFKGGYQSGRMGSNPFIAVGNTGSFYTEDGFRWIGSAYSEGGDRRRGGGEGKRHHKHVDHSGDYVIVSGNPFGAGRDRMLNDEWKGRREEDGSVRSSLTSVRGRRVKNVMDQFKGRVSHFAPPLGAVNPFAVKRADGHRRRGRKSCRRDKHRRHEDWDDEDCEVKREEREEEREERLNERQLADMDDEDEDERPVEIEEDGSIEENEDTEPSDGNDARPTETEVEKEKEEMREESEEGETDPELTPEAIENDETRTEVEENGEVDEEEGKEDGDKTAVEESEEEEDEMEENGETLVDEKEGKEDEGDKMDEENGEVKEDDETIEDSEEEVESEENGQEKETPDLVEGSEEVEEEPEGNEEATTKKEGPFEEEMNEETEEKKNYDEEENDDEEERLEGSEGEETVEDEENVEERGESETEEGETESAVEEDLNENDVDQEFEEDGDVESVNESKSDDIEWPESLENEEKDEVRDEKREEREKTPQENEEINEDGDNEEDEETPDDSESLEESEESTEEKEEASKVVEQPEEIEEESEMKEEEEETKDDTESDDKVAEEEVKEKENEEKTDASESIEETEGNEEKIAVNVEEPEETDSIEDEEEEETSKTIDEVVNEEKEEKGEELDEDEKVEEAEEIEEPEEDDLNGDGDEGKKESEEGETDPEMMPEAIEEKDEKIEEKEDEDDMEVQEDEENEGPEDKEEGQGTDVEMNYVEGREKGDTEKEEKKEKTPEEKAEEEFDMNPESVEGEDGDVKEDEGEGEEGNDEVNEEDENSEDPEGPESFDNGEEEGKEEEKRRRRRSVVYDSSLSTQSPVSRRLSIPRSSRLHRSRFSRLCVSSMAGQTISIGQCRQDFVYCKSARRPVVAACPVGDLFDAVMSTCVPTEMCGAEMAKMDALSPSSVPYSPTVSPREGMSQTTPTPSTSSPSSIHQIDVVKDPKNDDCSSLSDGAYPLSDCSPHYFVCSASRKTVHECPSDTVYDKPTDSCAWPRDVTACGVAAETPIVPMAETVYSSSSRNRDELATTAPTTLSPMHVHFECTKDGGFSIDCKGGFVMCSNGAASFMKCPHALTFDEYSQACQYPGHVGSCGVARIGSLDVATTPSYPSPYPSHSSSSRSFPYSPSIPSTTAPLTAVEVLVNTPVDKDACSGVSSGVEGATRECPSSFVICKEGQVTAVMNCVEGTFFNHKTKNCDYREIACAGGWNGEAHGVESPVEELPVEEVPTSSPVTEEYGRRASRPYRPSMPVDVEKIEKIEKEEVKRDEQKIVEEEMKVVVVPSIVEPTKEASCDWKGAASSGVCSTQFITCSNGRPEVFECSAGLVFVSSSSACEYPEFVSGCPQFKGTPPSPSSPSLSLSASPSTYSPSSTASPVISDAVMVDDSSPSEYTRRDETPSTTAIPPLVPLQTGEHTSAKFEATGDHCTFLAAQPSFPLNYCSMTYAVCTSEGLAYRTNCTFGFLFDSVIRRCVPSEHCGQPYMKEIGDGSPTLSSISVADWMGDSRCVGMEEGTLKATAICSGQYIRCHKESVVVETCSGAGRVFSPVTGRCVLKVQMAECSVSPRGPTPAITRPKTLPPSVPSSSSSPMTSLYSSTLPPPPPSHRGARIRGGLSVPSSSTHFDARSFCTTKHTDGLYRNPANCAGIVQCFGGEAFSYPSCSPGLFFNEVDGQCDYASNVPECASQADLIALDDSSASCKGQPHGAHLADDSDCSIYYRCVWGSLEKLSCPEGTVFNPRLSVCDYPSEVPHCQKQ